MLIKTCVTFGNSVPVYDEVGDVESCSRANLFLFNTFMSTVYPLHWRHDCHCAWLKFGMAKDNLMLRSLQYELHYQ